MWTRIFYIGTVNNIPLRLHVTWFWAVLLITAALAIYYFGLLSIWQSIVLGICVSLLFFISMSVRELARIHILKVMGVSIQSITMYIFGGVLRIADEEIRHIPELLTATVGSLLNLIIAGVFFALSTLFASGETSFTVELIQWVLYFNILIVIFNLFPGFPLDGGRILRSILWRITGNFSKSTRIAVLTGQVIAFLLILLGIGAVIIAMEWFTGVLLAVSGWFLVIATFAVRRRVLVRDALRGFTAYSMMTENFTPIKQQLTFNLVRDFIINSGQYCFVVIEKGVLQGIVTLRDIQIPQKRWDVAKISELMTPVKKLKTSDPDKPAAYLLEQMEENDLEQIPVIEEGKMIGLVTRGHLIRSLRARSVLRA
jgi:Zn-dependent protease